MQLSPIQYRDNGLRYCSGTGISDILHGQQSYTVLYRAMALRYFNWKALSNPLRDSTLRYCTETGLSDSVEGQPSQITYRARALVYCTVKYSLFESSLPGSANI